MQETVPCSSSAVENEAVQTGEKPSAIKQLVGRSLKSMGYTLSRNRVRSRLAFQHIPGWFSEDEAEMLYLLAATSPARRFLEIGHFLGRSTSAVCEAIRDAGVAVEFNSYDLGFTNAEEFIAHFKRVHDTTSSEVPAEYTELVYSQKKTTSEIAKLNLERFDLARYVRLISGDFTLLDQSQYGFIFCDALHDHGEIRVNLPHVIQASSDDCVWAFHDMSPANAAEVVKVSGARLIRVVDTLGVFRYERAGR
jgi:hypothetical protein